MISHFNAYFVSHIVWSKNGIFDFQNLKSKHKIYIVSTNLLMRICRPHSNKEFSILMFFSYLTYFVYKMEFLNFNRIYSKQNEKYTLYQKLCQTKFVDFIEVNNFAFLSFFRISYIMVRNLNF